MKILGSFIFAAQYEIVCFVPEKDPYDSVSPSKKTLLSIFIHKKNCHQRQGFLTGLAHKIVFQNVLRFTPIILYTVSVLQTDQPRIR